MQHRSNDHRSPLGYANQALGNSTVLFKRLPVYGLLLFLLSSCVPALDVRVQNTPSATSPASSEEQVEPVEQSGVPGARPAEEALLVLVTYLVIVAEFAGAVVIGVGVLRGVFRFIPHIVRPQPPGETYSEDIRLQLGKSLALALEFALAADILKTAVAPTFTVILQLAAIAALRTFLNYFLDRELREVEQRRARQASANAPQLAPALRPADQSDSERL